MATQPRGNRRNRTTATPDATPVAPDAATVDSAPVAPDASIAPTVDLRAIVRSFVVDGTGDAASITTAASTVHANTRAAVVATLPALVTDAAGDPAVVGRMIDANAAIAAAAPATATRQAVDNRPAMGVALAALVIATQHVALSFGGDDATVRGIAAALVDGGGDDATRADLTGQVAALVDSLTGQVNRTRVVHGRTLAAVPDGTVVAYGTGDQRTTATVRGDALVIGTGANAVRYTSPTAAARAVRPTSANGWQVWRGDGGTLAAIHDAATSATPDATSTGDDA